MVYDMSDKEIADVIKEASKRLNLSIIEAVTSDKKRECVSVLVNTDDFDKCMSLWGELYDVYSGAKALDGSKTEEYLAIIRSDILMPLIMVYTRSEASGLSADKDLIIPHGLVKLCEESEWKF